MTNNPKNAKYIFKKNCVTLKIAGNSAKFVQ